MSYETRAYDNEHGDPVVVLVATGTHDVSRLVHFLCSASPNSEQMRLGAVVKAQVYRHNGGRAALKLLASHGGPDFAEDDHPGLDRFCDWPGCFTYTNAVNGPWTGWKKSRRYLLCPEHSDTVHWADYVADERGAVVGARCDCGHVWDETPISLAVLKAWWQQHVATLSTPTNQKDGTSQ